MIVDGAYDVWTGNRTAFVTTENNDGRDEKHPILITSSAQLAYLAWNVNQGERYMNTYFKLAKNLDLDGKQWTPIGLSLIHI